MVFNKWAMTESVHTK